MGEGCEKCKELTLKLKKAQDQCDLLEETIEELREKYAALKERLKEATGGLY